MSTTYWELETATGVGKWELETSTGGVDDWLIEDATTTAVGQTLTLQYDIFGLVAKSLILKYDILAAVGQTLTLQYDIVNTIDTALLTQTGCTTPSALNTETTLFSKSDGPLNYAAFVSLDNMASGDKVVIRIKKWVQEDNRFELFEVKTIDFNDLPGRDPANEKQPAVYFPFVPAYRYRVTIEQTAGTARQFCWELFKLP